MFTYSKIESKAHIIVQPNQSPIGTIIWLHGLGASGHNFANIVPQLHLPNNLALRFIFPHAPVRPVTINNGYVMPAWFDIFSLAQHPERIDHEGVNKTIEFVHDLIQEEEKIYNILPENIILAGFSQGGMVALAGGLRYPKKLGGIMGLSTFLPNKDGLLTPHAIHQDTPIFMAHGLTDTIIPHSFAEATAEALRQQGLQIQWHSYSHMAHGVCTEEIKDISDWLQKKLIKA